MLNIPNMLTLTRIILVPVFIVALFQGYCKVSLCIFLFAGVTDALDGFIARRFNMCTRLGAVLDPLADKLLVVSSMLAFGWLGRLPIWLVATVIVRDMLIICGALAYFFLTGELEMEPSGLSKGNTFIQITLVLLVLANGAGFRSLSPLVSLMIPLGFAMALISGAHYVVVWTRRALSARQSNTVSRP